MDGFAKMMNKEAKKLMATGTHFVNSNGLHNDDHYTTAYDLYLIFNECIKNDDFVKIIKSKSHTAKVTGSSGAVRSITWEPTNFYATGEAEKPDNVTVIGGKTGTTKLAGNCLVLLTEDENNHPYISIVMNADTKPLLYKDMTAIVEAIPEK
jgi:D-alanyl-D-alanine carboxypeptidase